MLSYQPKLRPKPLYLRVLHDVSHGFLNIFEKMIFCIVSVLAPFYYIILVTEIRSTLVESYHPSVARQIFEAVISFYGFVNVFGNFLLAFCTDTSVRCLNFNEDAAEYCNSCNKSRPAEAWHCKTCNNCILRRDHHCIALSKCVGLRNMRYFLLFLIYVTISMIYCNIYLYYYLKAKCGEDACGIIPQILIFALFRAVVLSQVLKIEGFLDYGWQIMCIKFSVMMNIGFFMLSFYMFLYHGSNVFNGVTSWEAHKRMTRPGPLRMKLKRVFGLRWYLAIFWPFVSSSLPDECEIKNL